MKAYLEIEMPRCCNKCPMLVYEGHTLCICRALPAIEDGEILKPWKNKRKDCPLKPIPPHGRLIDADALAKRIKDEGRNQAEYYADRYAPVVMAYGDCYGKVQSAPTIIPSEEAE